ncbi:MAG: alkaline phosphatase family protein [Chloroflexi bacterium]|nr:alkaline phosphatase family protein [Chloroflexota bacterium]
MKTLRTALIIGIAVVCTGTISACTLTAPADNSQAQNAAAGTPYVSAPPCGSTSTYLPLIGEGGGSSPLTTQAPSLTLPCVPAFSRIYLIVMENHSYESIVGNASAPYINSLIARYGLATNYNGVAHPSQPNYLALFSGSTQGITDDFRHDITAPNVADQLDAHGKTWRVFAQNVPLNCYTDMLASGGEDGAGGYARRHNAAISFTGIADSPARCANITDFAHFDPAAADYALIIPNTCNDMHDTLCPGGVNSVANGDTFLKGFVPKILNSSAWDDRSVLFITWDESEAIGNHVATLVISNKTPKGLRSATAHNHYSLLRTIQDAWSLGCLANTCTANNLAEFFH